MHFWSIRFKPIQQIPTVCINQGFTHPVERIKFCLWSISTPMKFLLTVSLGLFTATGHKVAVNGDLVVIAICNIATLRRWVNIGGWLQLFSVLMLILSFACTLCSILSFPFSFPCNSNGRSVVHADWKSAITKGTWALSLWIGSTSMLEIVDGQFWWKNLKRDSGFFLLLDNFYFERLLDSCLMNTVFLVKTLLNS